MNKIISTVFVCIFILCGYVQAVPSFGEEFEFSQPDGSKVKVRVWGDEFYRRMESFGRLYAAKRKGQPTGYAMPIFRTIRQNLFRPVIFIAGQRHGGKYQGVDSTKQVAA